MSRDAAGTLVLSDQPTRRRGQHLRGPQCLATSGRRAARNADVEGIYDEAIESASATHGVRPELVRAVIQVESGFNPRARSHVGAMGLMQLMPATAAELGVDNPWDPVQNIHGGVAYLGSLIREFGDEVLALAAYNAGPGAVNRYGQRVPPYRETQDYVQKITRRTDAMPVARERTDGHLQGARRGRRSAAVAPDRHQAEERPLRSHPLGRTRVEPTAVAVALDASPRLPAARIVRTSIARRPIRARR